MILYFSGTGNSEYVAKRIGNDIQDEVIDLFERIRKQDFSVLTSEKPWVLVVPTYAWRIPRVVEDWMMKTELSGCRDIYFVMTCGDGIANAGAYAKKECQKKGLNYKGCEGIVMPENYIALFSAPGKEEALKIIDLAEAKITAASQYISVGEPFPAKRLTFQDKFCSGPINLIFYPMYVHGKKFYATKACVSCGKCAEVCPLHNIHLEDGKPAWGDECTHCMACICKCPKAAIEYGKKSKGKNRYVCPKKL